MTLEFVGHRVMACSQPILKNEKIFQALVDKSGG